MTQSFVLVDAVEDQPVRDELHVLAAEWQRDGTELHYEVKPFLERAFLLQIHRSNKFTRFVMRAIRIGVKTVSIYEEIA